MSTKTLQYLLGAVKNVAHLGDTDVFPYPIENQIFFDKPSEVAGLLFERHKNFKESLKRYPPIHQSMLSAVGYTGLRWATQLDPMWNAYLLAMVMSIGDQIESVRVPVHREIVFSYRFSWNRADGNIFSRDVGWVDFQKKSVEHARKFASVLVCDISDFYPRIYHHRLENSLKKAAKGADAVWRIMRLLKYFSKNASYGLPVGGPAARLLSELLLNRVDKLLLAEGIVFCRYADDYHLFSNSEEESYKLLVSLSTKLLENEGLLLQKGKTRILTSDEFMRTSEFSDLNQPDNSLEASSREFMRLRLYYDPYSPTADQEYDSLKAELARFDVVGMLAREIRKSRIHQALTRKLVNAIQHVDSQQKSGAVVSLVDNLEALYPVMPAVVMTIKSVLPELDDPTKELIFSRLRHLLSVGSYVLTVPAHLAYAVRLIAYDTSEETDELLVRVYNQSTSSSIRRDIILAMAARESDYWISDLKNRFSLLSPWERVALIIASTVLPGDEGDHWRKNTRDGFSDFESLVERWTEERVATGSWKVPI